ncbi:hypothetical protein V2S85_03040 [Novosphingobium resinovorum]|nr:hypothetical protein [Novosphingobium resinovorum]
MFNNDKGVNSFMRQDDEPQGAVTTPSGSPASGPDARPQPHDPIDVHLFEDILELEGGLRLTTQATAGLGAPRAGEVAALGLRLPEPASSTLQELSERIRTATQAGDLGAIRESQLAVIEALAELRSMLWSKESE